MSAMQVEASFWHLRVPTGHVVGQNVPPSTPTNAVSPLTRGIAISVCYRKAKLSAVAMPLLLSQVLYRRRTLMMVNSMVGLAIRSRHAARSAKYAVGTGSKGKGLRLSKRSHP